MLSATRGELPTQTHVNKRLRTETLGTGIGPSLSQRSKPHASDK